jgi:hypothetical protein
MVVTGFPIAWKRRIFPSAVDPMHVRVACFAVAVVIPVGYGTRNTKKQANRRASEHFQAKKQNVNA